MTQSEMAALLGRPLTPIEVANYDSYLEIAEELLQGVICYPLCSKAETRTFKARGGYSTVFTGAFSIVSSVEVDGQAVTDYEPALWDNANAKWFNSLVFDHKPQMGAKITVTAQWGFSKLPADLQRLLSKYFALVSSGAKNEANVQSKRVEDYQITYGNVDQTKAEQIANANASTIGKYSICNIGNVQHGRKC